VKVILKVRAPVDELTQPDVYEWHVRVKVDDYQADVFVDDETGFDDAKLQAYLESIEDRLLQMGIYNWKRMINVRDEIYKIWKFLEEIKSL